MKKILILCAVTLFVGGVLLYRHLRMPSVFGTFTGAPRAEVADLVERPEAMRRTTWSVEGVIRDQCTTMGCFFFLREGKATLRVDLAEIAMNAPKKMNGRKAHVEGQLVPFDHGYQLWASAVEFE